MAMVTDRVGRLIAYKWSELLPYKWSQLNSLPYGINRVLAAAQNAADARGNRLTASQTAVERIPLVQYSALETAVTNMQTAADKLLAALN